MQKLRLPRLIRAWIWLFVISVFMAIPAQAQAENLLTNPSFEDEFVTIDDDPLRVVATGWTPWHIPRTPDMRAFENAFPFYVDAAQASERGIVPRARTGSEAQIYYSFFETHDGGVYQQVSGLTPGDELRFSAYIHVWSTTFADPDVSEAPGDVVVRVGIDPTGGTDANADTVVYSPPVINYDTFRQYAVIATARSSTVTVFVRSTIGSPVRNTVIYVDDAVLEVTPESVDETEQPTEEVTEEATEEPTSEVPGIGDETPAPTEEPTEEATEEPATEEPATEEPATEEPATEEPATEEPTEEPATEEPTEEPATEEPTEEPATEEPTATSTATETQAPTATVTPTATATTVPTETATPTMLPTEEGEDIGIIVPTDPDESEPPTPTQETDTGLVATATPITATTPTVQVPDEETTEEPTQPLLQEFAGQIIHRVQPGDTVQRIAQLYGSSIDAIRQANGLDSSYLIFVGQNLIVPVRIVPVTITPSVTPVIASTPTPDSAAEQPPTEPPAEQASTMLYVVAPGDTLLGIANRFNTTVTTLLRLNAIANPNRIFWGQVLVVPMPGAGLPPVPPAPTTYVVQPGDYLVSIAIRFGVSLNALAEANGIVNTNRIFVGQRLVIPR